MASEYPTPNFAFTSLGCRPGELSSHRRSLETKPLAAVNISAPAIPEEVPRDPFRNLREQREKKQSDGFHYDPFSIQKQLID
jgi:hypothetical protein